jgi:uncharacterized membrane protein
MSFVWWLGSSTEQRASLPTAPQLAQKNGCEMIMIGICLLMLRGSGRIAFASGSFLAILCSREQVSRRFIQVSAEWDGNEL